MEAVGGELLKALLSSSIPAAILFWYLQKALVRIDTLEKTVADLYKGNQEKMELYLNKAFETATTNATVLGANTSAINGLKDLITVRNNG